MGYVTSFDFIPSRRYPFPFLFPSLNIFEKMYINKKKYINKKDKKNTNKIPEKKDIKKSKKSKY